MAQSITVSCEDAPITIAASLRSLPCSPTTQKVDRDGGVVSCCGAHVAHKQHESLFDGASGLDFWKWKLGRGTEACVLQ